MITMEEIVEKLGSMTPMELVSLTKELEEKWGVKAVPQVVKQGDVPVQTENTQTEFIVMLVSVPADKKMTVIKAVRELTLMGLKESKELVEAAPKSIKENASKDEAEAIKAKLTEAGAVVEVK